MNYLEDFYTNYDEEGRLLKQHGRVEYLTTMKYIHELLGDAKKKILEVGAGTGRYSIALAKEGHEVDALEYTKHNLEVMNSKILGIQNIRTHQGTALDLSRFGDETFDESTAVRVTRKKEKATRSEPKKGIRGEPKKGIKGLVVLAVLEVVAILVVLLRWALWFL